MEKVLLGKVITHGYRFEKDRHWGSKVVAVSEANYKEFYRTNESIGYDESKQSNYIYYQGFPYKVEEPLIDIVNQVKIFKTDKIIEEIHDVEALKDAYKEVVEFWKDKYIDRCQEADDAVSNKKWYQLFSRK